MASYDVASTTVSARPAALATLSNPNTRLPRNGVTALRRAVPALNPEAGEVQVKLEEAAYLLRIPQRKPWGTMAGGAGPDIARHVVGRLVTQKRGFKQRVDNAASGICLALTAGDVKGSLSIVREKRARLLETVPAGAAMVTAEAACDELAELLGELGGIAGAQDTERFDRGVAMALDAVSRLKVLQAPGLPFQLPKRWGCDTPSSPPHIST